MLNWTHLGFEHRVTECIFFEDFFLFPLQIHQPVCLSFLTGVLSVTTFYGWPHKLEVKICNHGEPGLVVRMHILPHYILRTAPGSWFFLERVRVGGSGREALWQAVIVENPVYFFVRSTINDANVNFSFFFNSSFFYSNTLGVFLPPTSHILNDLKPLLVQQSGANLSITFPPTQNHRISAVQTRCILALMHVLHRTLLLHQHFLTIIISL